MPAAGWAVFGRFSGVRGVSARAADCGAHACSGTSCGPSPPEAAARCGFFTKPQIQNSIFKIHCGLPIAARRATSARLFVFGTQPAKGARDCKELRASAGRRLRPANRCAIDSLQKARSRAVGLRPLGAALRPGAAAGCRPLRDRFCQHPFPLQLAAAGCRRLRRRIYRQFFAAAGCRSLTGSIHCFPSLRDGISSPKSVAAVHPVMRTRT